jgi:branched-chain amino acid transport system permease protein
MTLVQHDSPSSGLHDEPHRPVRLPMVRRARRELVAVTVLVIITIGLGTVSPVLATTAAFTMTFILMGQSWNLISGLAGPLALGQAAFFGITDFSVLVLRTAGVNQYVGILVGVAASLLLALIVGLATLRLPGFFFAIASLMVPLIIQAVILYFGYFQVERPFNVNDDPGDFYFTDPWSYLLIGGILVIIVAALTAVISGRKIGRYFVAIRENQRAAEAAGIPVFRYKIYAFLIASVFASLAGAFYGQLTFVFDPLDAFDPSVSVQALVVALVGGAGTVLGPVLGGLIIIPAAQFARTYLYQLPGLDQISYAVLLLIVALWFPRGAYPTVALYLRNRRARRASRPPAGTTSEPPAAAAPEPEGQDTR